MRGGHSLSERLSLVGGKRFWNEATTGVEEGAVLLEFCDVGGGRWVDKSHGMACCSAPLGLEGSGLWLAW